MKTWRQVYRGKIKYGHTLTDAELIGHVQRMKSPEENRCGYAAISNAFNLRFALHEMKRRKLVLLDKNRAK